MCARTFGVLHAVHAHRMTERYAKRTQPLPGGLHLLVRVRIPRAVHAHQTAARDVCRCSVHRLAL
ncbi:hypothetical protein Xcom_15975 [Xanthomonas axonopodis pv. commiphoreae]|nr:hypothetical protein Xcom_15975 [Xanthomonas axonopodis pv. commiphoreae]